MTPHPVFNDRGILFFTPDRRTRDRRVFGSEGGQDEGANVPGESWEIQSVVRASRDSPAVMSLYIAPVT